jgi:hypothetical protein
MTLNAKLKAAWEEAEAKGMKVFMQKEDMRAKPNPIEQRLDADGLPATIIAPASQTKPLIKYGYRIAPKPAAVPDGVEEADGQGTAKPRPTTRKR